MMKSTEVQALIWSIAKRCVAKNQQQPKLQKAQQQPRSWIYPVEHKGWFWLAIIQATVTMICYHIMTMNAPSMQRRSHQSIAKNWCKSLWWYMVHWYSGTVVYGALVQLHHSKHWCMHVHQAGVAILQSGGWQHCCPRISIYFGWLWQILRGAGLSIWGQKPLNFSPFCTVLHSLVQKTCSAAKTNVIENTHPWHQNNHPWHQEEAAGATCAPFQTPEPCSIVTPDNYSFCPCTRAGATKMQQCMYTKLALALKTPW